MLFFRRYHRSPFVRAANPYRLLFVDKSHHRKGIAAKLVGEAAAHMKGLGYGQIDVNASGYGMPAYQQLGFRATGPEKTVNGIRFTPMLLIIKD